MTLPEETPCISEYCISPDIYIFDSLKKCAG
jgi:hypothetical protein